MPSLGFLWHDAFLVHNPGPDHPEGASRLIAIRQELARGPIEGLVALPPREADDAELYFVHRPEYVERVEIQCRMGKRYLDSLDTGICPESQRIARLAVGAGLVGVDAVMEGRVRRAFGAVRPPGHHAEADRAMGFCLFNNVAVAARYAQSLHGVSRVLICDFDVHHGNGTQHTFYADASVFYMSVHQHPFYPGTGDAGETGSGEGIGCTFNVPLPTGGGDPEFVAALEELAERMDTFRPELVLVSAGFDAHEGDPLAGMRVSVSGYRRMTEILCGIADRHAKGRLVSLLEGGYHLTNLSLAVRAHMEQLAR